MRVVVARGRPGARSGRPPPRSRGRPRSERPRSPVTARTVRPSRSAIAASGAITASLRSWSASVAPSRANSSVMAGPMKWLTLVTRQTLPVSFTVRRRTPCRRASWFARSVDRIRRRGQGRRSKMQADSRACRAGEAGPSPPTGFSSPSPPATRFPSITSSGTPSGRSWAGKSVIVSAPTGAGQDTGGGVRDPRARSAAAGASPTRRRSRRCRTRSSPTSAASSAPIRSASSPATSR